MDTRPNPRLQRTPSASPPPPLSRQPLGRARITAAAIATVVLTIAAMQAADETVTGSWQFPDRSVWVRILSDGRAFQCRIDPKGEVFRSEGRLLDNGKLEWRENWGVETVARDGEAITLTGKRTFRYVRARSEMNAACKAPF